MHDAPDASKAAIEIQPSEAKRCTSASRRERAPSTTVCAGSTAPTATVTAFAAFSAALSVARVFAERPFRLRAFPTSWVSAFASAA